MITNAKPGGKGSKPDPAFADEPKKGSTIKTISLLTKKEAQQNPLAVETGVEEEEGAPPPKKKASTPAPDYGMPVHPVANMFDLMEGKPFEQLVADIKEHGLVNPV